ncbi:MAG TPA: SHOCT domain-containing protein [Actinomycetota bacterium]|nr:SHOCT domain-containing protein [Actinomycetota bacterium]
MMWDGMWGWGGLGLLWMALFWVGIALLVVWSVRQFGGGSGGGSERRALEILEERFARGEIDRDEFEERKRVLEGR